MVDLVTVGVGILLLISGAILGYFLFSQPAINELEGMIDEMADELREQEDTESEVTK